MRAVPVAGEDAAIAFPVCVHRNLYGTSVAFVPSNLHCFPARNTAAASVLALAPAPGQEHVERSRAHVSTAKELTACVSRSVQMSGKDPEKPHKRDPSRSVLRSLVVVFTSCG